MHVLGRGKRIFEILNFFRKSNETKSAFNFKLHNTRNKRIRFTVGWKPLLVGLNARLQDACNAEIIPAVRLLCIKLTTYKGISPAEYTIARGINELYSWWTNWSCTIVCVIICIKRPCLDLYTDGGGGGGGGKWITRRNARDGAVETKIR